MFEACYTKCQDMSELEDKVGDRKSIHSSSVLIQSIHLRSLLTIGMCS